MIVQLPNNTLAVSFQASAYGEGCNDQSIFFKISTDGGVNWTPHTVIASGDYAIWGLVLLKVSLSMSSKPFLPDLSSFSPFQPGASL